MGETISVDKELFSINNDETKSKFANYLLDHKMAKKLFNDTPISDIPMYKFHLCKNMNIGMAEFIGFELINTN